MDSDLPKVLHPLNGKPLLVHVIESLKKAGADPIITVIGYKGEMVAEAVKGCSDTVYQKEQLGTGHAVMQARESLRDYSGPVIVACGDVPMIKPDTFKSLSRALGEPDVKAAVLVMKPDNPYGYGRVVKDKEGNFLKIVEEKDASEDQKKIQEVNTGTYAFDKEFLFEGLEKTDTNNAQREYYLPDALNFILGSGYRVKTLCLEDPVEGSGINSPEELLVLENYIKTRE